MDLLSINTKKVAEEIGVSTVIINRYSRGENEPSYNTLTKFCDAYFVNIDWMVTGRGEVFKKKEIEKREQAQKILKAIAVLKVERDITFREIQEQLNLSKSFFSELKRGRTSLPYDKIRKLQEVYGVSI